MSKTELAKDLHNLQSKFCNPRSDKQYPELKARMQAFMVKTNRSWSNTMLYLLNLGLDIEDENEKIIQKARK